MAAAAAVAQKFLCPPYPAHPVAENDNPPPLSAAAAYRQNLYLARQPHPTHPAAAAAAESCVDDLPLPRVAAAAQQRLHRGHHHGAAAEERFPLVLASHFPQ